MLHLLDPRLEQTTEKVPMYACARRERSSEATVYSNRLSVWVPTTFARLRWRFWAVRIARIHTLSLIPGETKNDKNLVAGECDRMRRDSATIHCGWHGRIQCVEQGCRRLQFWTQRAHKTRNWGEHQLNDERRDSVEWGWAEQTQYGRKH